MAKLAAAVVALAGCDDVGMTTIGPGVPMLTIGMPDTASGPRTITPAPAPDLAFDSALNTIRSTAGLPPATPEARLIAAAQAHAEDMVANGYIAHRSPTGVRMRDRLTALGYPHCAAAENIGSGHADSMAAIRGWAGSPAHARNLLLPGPVEYGFGRAGSVYVLLLSQIC